MYFITMILQEKGDWTNRWDVKAWDLAQKNILVIGFGRIGSNFVKRALAFDMNVYVYDPYVEKEKVKISGAIPVDNISENLSKDGCCNSSLSKE